MGPGPVDLRFWSVRRTFGGRATHIAARRGAMETLDGGTGPARRRAAFIFQPGYNIVALIGRYTECGGSLEAKRYRWRSRITPFAYYALYPMTMWHAPGNDTNVRCLPAAERTRWQHPPAIASPRAGGPGPDGRHISSDSGPRQGSEWASRWCPQVRHGMPRHRHWLLLAVDWGMRLNRT